MLKTHEHKTKYTFFKNSFYLFKYFLENRNVMLLNHSFIGSYKETTANPTNISLTCMFVCLFVYLFVFYFAKIIS